MRESIGHTRARKQQLLKRKQQTLDRKKQLIERKHRTIKRTEHLLKRKQYVKFQVCDCILYCAPDRSGILLRPESKAEDWVKEEDDGKLR